MDQAEDAAESIVRLKSGINLGKLVSDAGTTFEIDLSDVQENFESMSTENPANLLNYSNLDCLGLSDEDTYNDEPFTQLAKKMEDLLPDGKIKKRILRQGVGEIVTENASITCDYNAFFEYNPEPFDSTYAFHRSFRFQLGAGLVLPGLELAVKSMKMNEKSQFLIHPDYAYGSMGCLDRIPENATILFEIELRNYINLGEAETVEEAGEEDSFEKNYQRAEALHLKGNDFYKRDLYRQAIKQYNMAICKLEHSRLNDYEDQKKQQSLLLKLYTNLVVVYTKNQKARKACQAANDLTYIVKGTSLKIPVKVHYNHARALIMLDNFSEAEKKLKLAHRLEPNSSEIAAEFVKLEKLKKQSLEREKLICKALIGNSKESDKPVLTEEFKSEIQKTLTALVDDPDWLQYKLNDGMSEEEHEYVRNEALKRSLKFRQDEKHFYVYKPEINK
nr:inactive peptidyl-prolyl cis-trans isomerase FKBP6 [Onthophagus taurus]